MTRVCTGRRVTEREREKESDRQRDQQRVSESLRASKRERERDRASEWDRISFTNMSNSVLVFFFSSSSLLTRSSPGALLWDLRSECRYYNPKILEYYFASRNRMLSNARLAAACGNTRASALAGVSVNNTRGTAMGKALKGHDVHLLPVTHVIIPTRLATH